jgi:hypothetical protein
LRLTFAAVVAAAALIIVAPASATTLGSTAVAAGTCGSDLIAWQTDPAFTVPAGGGIITSLSTNAPSAGGHVTLKVLRPAGGGNVTVLASTPPITETAGVNTVAMNLAVQAGDLLGIYTPDGSNCAVATPGSVFYKEPAGGDPAVGATIAPTSPAAATIAVSATFEADADHDGFGDETQDSCPTDPSIHTGPCMTDLRAGQTVTPTTIGVGDVAVATVTLANGSTGLAQGVTATAKVTPGLQVVSMIPGSGCSFSPDLSCSFGSLAGGASTVAAIVVRGVSTGAQSVTTTVGTSGSDPNAANNATSTAITVEKRVAVKCNVPSLKGLTKSVAKRLLKVANCKLGKVKRKSGPVTKQSPRAGKVLPAGSKVSVTLRK